MRERTGASQWEFPTEADEEEDSKDSPCTQTLGQEATKTSGGVTGQTLTGFMNVVTKGRINVVSHTPLVN